MIIVVYHGHLQIGLIGRRFLETVEDLNLTGRACRSDNLFGTYAPRS